MRYAAEGVPLVVLAGKEYGSGSSRDWAAKGTALLGVRAVIAQSFERIHRSNLIGMGVLPLQFSEGQSAGALGLTGHEVFSITGLELAQRRGRARRPSPCGRRRRRTGRRVRGPAAHRHPDGGRVLPPRRASCTTCCARWPVEVSTGPDRAAPSRPVIGGHRSTALTSPELNRPAAGRTRR